MKKLTKHISCLILALSAFHANAGKNIKVTVKTSEKNAAAIGFTVDNRNSGSLGRNHTGEGPKGMLYRFGYKKHTPFGDNISCGSMILTENSTVTLLLQGDQCISILS